jgi:hypothetical protein
MGFVLAAKRGDVPPGTIREFQVEGKAVALRMWPGNSTPLITLAFIAEGRLGMVRWRGRW